MSAENVQLATRLMEALPLDDLAGAFRNPERREEMAATWASVADPEIEVVRVGPAYTGEPVTYGGLDGFLEFWTDWLEPWHTFRIENEGFLDAGNRVVMLARQRGRTEAGGAVIEGRGAAVMTITDGTLTRIEFHLDRDRAMRSAGLAD